MTQENRKLLWDELVEAGVKFDQHYRNYTEQMLQEAVDRLHAAQAKKAASAAIIFPDELVDEEPENFVEQPAPTKEELAGARTATHGINDPIRTDPDGTIWYQQEVRKPPYAKPRGRRKIQYVDPGVVQRTIRNDSDGSTETVEMPGSERRSSEVRITLPSYQTGIYRDPRFPQFKIHVYNDHRGFDLFDVAEYFGGRDLVPDEIKTIYVSTDLCYDIRTTVRFIEAEYRRLQLQGAIR